jgi:hypothetical protein
MQDPEDAYTVHRIQQEKEIARIFSEHTKV